MTIERVVQTRYIPIPLKRTPLGEGETVEEFLYSRRKYGVYGNLAEYSDGLKVVSEDEISLYTNAFGSLIRFPETTYNLKQKEINRAKVESTHRKTRLTKTMYKWRPAP